MTAISRPLDGRVALVTGAGRFSGIGAACADHLAQLGAHIVISDIARPRADLQVATVGLGESRDTLDTIAEAISIRHGIRCLPIDFDVTEPFEAQQAIDTTIAEFGRLDVLVNNAGTAAGIGAFEAGTDGAWDLAWQVNVLGMSRLSRLALPHLSARAEGAIVNVASTAGLIGLAGYGAYNVTKHGVVGLTRLLAAELGPRGVRVNAVAPGFIHTDMGAAELELMAQDLNGSVADATRTAVDSIPLRRLGTPRDVAEVVGWLASYANYVNGTIIPVDGGSGR